MPSATEKGQEEMEKQLKDDFRYHMRNVRPAFYHAQGYNGRNALPEKANGVAVEALRRAQIRHWR